MNRRQSILSMIGSVLSFGLFGNQTTYSCNVGHCVRPDLLNNEDEWNRIDLENLKGWEHKTPVFERAAILDNKTLVPHFTLRPCKVWKRKFIPDKGKSFDMPSVIASYEGPVVNMETGQVVNYPMSN